MSKKEVFNDKEDNFTFENEVIEPDIKIKEPEIVGNTVDLIFRENRGFELHIGRKIFKFNGREKKTLPREILEHKDFTENMKKLFTII